MTDEELFGHYPQLFHMTAEDAWPGIRDHGLLTTRQIVDEAVTDPAQRRALLQTRRTESTTLQHSRLGSVTIRDQGPLVERNLRLTDLTFEDWLDVLNGRVFFWLHPRKLAGLLKARPYRNSVHDVIVCDTASLLRAHRDQIRLSPINSGSTQFPNAPPRGSHTFRTIDEQQWPVVPRRPLKDAIAELAGIEGVADLAQHMVRVERHYPEGRTLRLAWHPAAPVKNMFRCACAASPGDPMTASPHF